jgi:hypothetical protein
MRFALPPSQIRGNGGACSTPELFAMEPHGCTGAAAGKILTASVSHEGGILRIAAEGPREPMFLKRDEHGVHQDEESTGAKSVGKVPKSHAQPSSILKFTTRMCEPF